MSSNYEKPKPNPIIQAIQSKGGCRIQKLTGFVAEGEAGKVKMYLDLSLDTSFEIREDDVLYVIDPEKSTQPSLVFVRDDARITIGREVSASVAAALSSGTHACAAPKLAAVAGKKADDGDPLDPELRCLLNYLGDVIKCLTKHDDPLLQQACKDSALAAYSLCRSLGPHPDGGVVAPA